VLLTGRKHQQGLGADVHRLVQEQRTELLAERRPARLAGHHHFAPASASQPLGKPLQMRALAGAVDAFEGDELSAHESRRGYGRPPR
jgi:hypothetical protein